MVRLISVLCGGILLLGGALAQSGGSFDGVPGGSLTGGDASSAGSELNSSTFVSSLRTV